MKLTKLKLKQLIKEELQKVLQEGGSIPPDDADPCRTNPCSPECQDPDIRRHPERHGYKNFQDCYSQCEEGLRGDASVLCAPPCKKLKYPGKCPGLGHSTTGG